MKFNSIKNSFRVFLLASLLTFSGINLFGNVFKVINGSTTNVELGNNLIPHTGTGGCTVPQTTFRATVTAADTICASSKLVLRKVNVSFNHTYTGDIDMWLISPWGQRILLFDQHGAAGDNLTNVNFIDNTCARLISTGVNPFTGTWRPNNPTGTPSCAGAGAGTGVATLAATIDHAVGTWTLGFSDAFPGDGGTMISWSLEFGPTPLTINDAAMARTVVLPVACLCQPAPTMLGACSGTPPTCFYKFIPAIPPASTDLDGGFSPVPADGICIAPGTYNVLYSTTGDCSGDTAVQTITSPTDVTPPTFLPACPKQVVLQLGPGECEAVWSAPPFMAMDNCPASSVFGAKRTFSNSCPAVPPNTWVTTLVRHTDRKSVV